MIYELNKADYEKGRPLFQPLAHQLMSAVVLDGARPGQVFVDDPTDPQTAFMFTLAMWGYLAGDPNNGEFNRALHEVIHKGWDHLSHTRLCDEFECLHGVPGWTAVLDRVEQNRRELS